MTAPFNLTSHMTLFLDAGATILGTPELDLHPPIPPLPSYGGSLRPMSLIHGEMGSHLLRYRLDTYFNHAIVCGLSYK